MSENVVENRYPRIILGLDVSTACIGVSIVADRGEGKPEILKLTHVSPKIDKKVKGIESLFLRKNIFEEEFVPILKEYPITDVIIEEPLLSSNNVNTVATLLRYNGMISESIYRHLQIVPKFISSYDARLYSYPDLASIRKYNRKGDEYSLKHILSAINDDSLVLFGSYPYDVDKKTIMMDKVNDDYPEIEWILNKKGEIAKENYDACDSLICALAYINVNRYGLSEPTIVNHSVSQTDDGKTVISYIAKIWDREMPKTLTLGKQLLNIEKKK